ncbi:MAG: hypothetical protein H5T97_04355 [Firmicutes bacterium]|nr:hypothetical protein [Bacillota bacterium]
MPGRVLNGRKEKVFFREVHHLRQWWVWLVVLFAAGLAWQAAGRRLLLGVPAGGDPGSDLRLFAVWVFFGVLLPALFWWGRLVVEVRADGLYLRWFPFWLSYRRIPFGRVRGYTARPEGRGDAAACALAGGRGVEVELVDGGRLFVASRRPEEMVRAMDALLAGDAARWGAARAWAAYRDTRDGDAGGGGGTSREAELGPG